MTRRNLLGLTCEPFYYFIPTRESSLSTHSMRTPVRPVFYGRIRHYACCFLSRQFPPGRNLICWCQPVRLPSQHSVSSFRPDGIGTVTVEEKERFEEIKERLRVLLENQITHFRWGSVLWGPVRDRNENAQRIFISVKRQINNSFMSIRDI